MNEKCIVVGDRAAGKFVALADSIRKVQSRPNAVIVDDLLEDVVLDPKTIKKYYEEILFAQNGGLK